MHHNAFSHFFANISVLAATIIAAIALAVYTAFIAWGVLSNRWKNHADPDFYRSTIQNRKPLDHPGQTGQFAR